jgi:hypothetical protein
MWCTVATKQWEVNTYSSWVGYIFENYPEMHLCITDLLIKWQWHYMDESANEEPAKLNRDMAL